MVEWESVEVTYEPLTLISKDDPITCPVYAKKHDLLDTTGWEHLKRYAKTSKRLIRAVKQSTPSMTCQSTTPPVSPGKCPLDRPTICTPSYHIHQTNCHRHTICTTHQPVRQTIHHHHTVCTTHQSVHLHVRHQVTV